MVLDPEDLFPESVIPSRDLIKETHAIFAVHRLSPGGKTDPKEGQINPGGQEVFHATWRDQGQGPARVRVRTSRERYKVNFLKEWRIQEDEHDDFQTNKE